MNISLDPVPGEISLLGGRCFGTCQLMVVPEVVALVASSILFIMPAKRMIKIKIQCSSALASQWRGYRRKRTDRLAKLPGSFIHPFTLSGDVAHLTTSPKIS